MTSMEFKSSLLQIQALPLSFVLLLTTVIILGFGGMITRPSFPVKTPRFSRGWPVLGSLGFFSGRKDFLDDGKLKSKTGSFSFYYGPHPIVALSGLKGRTTMYTTRGMDFVQGYRHLFAAGPNIKFLHGELSTFFTTTLRRLATRERLTIAIPYMIDDINALIHRQDTSNPFPAISTMWSLTYQITNRALGVHDIADDPRLAAKTIPFFKNMDRSSALEIMFPLLPTPNKVGNLWSGARMFWVLVRILNERRRTGKRKADTMQVLVDQGCNTIKICAFVIGALFAGTLNTGINAGWVLVFLAADRHWYTEVQQQVDDVLARHRLHEIELPIEIFHRLTLEEWESEFNLIDLSLRESIRLSMPGAAIRRNISGKDIEIGDTGEVVPKDMFAVYLLDDVHMNEDIYSNPQEFDPGRYLPDRAEDKKVPNAFLGWGTGLHPCLGMKVAKVEIIVMTAMMFAYFDFALCNKDGSVRETPLKMIDRNSLGGDKHKASGENYLSLKPRKWFIQY